MLLITHYQRMLDYVHPDFVHVLFDGRIIKSGGPELAHELEAEGYERHHRRGGVVTDPKVKDIAPDNYKWGFHDEARYPFRTERGLSRKVVEEISGIKDEPQWMRDLRLSALEVFEKPMPSGGRTFQLSISTTSTTTRVPPTAEHDWSDVPEYIKETFDRLGIPEAEKKFLAGVKAQYESEVVYGRSARSSRSRA